MKSHLSVCVKYREVKAYVNEIIRFTRLVLRVCAIMGIQIPLSVTGREVLMHVHLVSDQRGHTLNGLMTYRNTTVV